MKYFTYEEILLLHSMIIDETGGLHGIRDRNQILTLADLPRQKVFGKELYKGLFVKTAVYARNIITGHPFLDGNKRTAMVVAGTFLEDNGYILIADEGEIEKFALDIVRKKYDVERISVWFQRHSKKIKK